jgi:hypothetical protein
MRSDYVCAGDRRESNGMNTQDADMRELALAWIDANLHAALDHIAKNHWLDLTESTRF